MYKIKARTHLDYSPYSNKLTKKFLFNEYTKKHKTALEISKQVGCSDTAVYHALHRLGLTINKYKGKFHVWYGRKHSLKTRKKLSILRKGKGKGKSNPMYGKRAKPKKYKYKNFWMRSTWEVKYAKWLDSKNIQWKYESKTFDLGKCTYTPDFYLPTLKQYIEIKGFWRNGFYKTKLFKALYGNINYKILYKKDLQKLGLKRLNKGSLL